jgi:hypothetical protein
MTGSLVVVVIIGVILIGWMIQRLVFAPADREAEKWVEKLLEEQARNRNGSVNVSGRRASLTVPHKNINIEVSSAGIAGGGDGGDFDYFYARFRLNVFTDKDFSLIVKSDGLLKPYFSRLEVLDKRFGERYVAAGSDSSFLNGVLTPEIRDKLLEASLNVQFGRRVGYGVGERGWLTVFKWHFVTEDAYDSMIETAILFYERFEELGRHVEQPNRT